MTIILLRRRRRSLLPDIDRAFTKFELVNLVITKTKYKTQERRELIVVAIMQHQKTLGIKICNHRTIPERRWKSTRRMARYLSVKWDTKDDLHMLIHLILLASLSIVIVNWVEHLTEPTSPTWYMQDMMRGWLKLAYSPSLASRRTEGKYVEQLLQFRVTCRLQRMWSPKPTREMQQRIHCSQPLRHLVLLERRIRYCWKRGSRS